MTIVRKCVVSSMSASTAMPAQQQASGINTNTLSLYTTITTIIRKCVFSIDTAGAELQKTASGPKYSNQPESPTKAQEEQKESLFHSL